MVSTHLFVFCVAAVCLSLSNGLLSIDRELEWWETTLMYEIYPQSFKDSDGDGVGDLNGIYEKLDYLKDIGVESVWINPFFKSPMADMGYDVSDYRAVDPLFGTMEDFQKLVKGMHDRGLKIIIDFIPNHTSDESEWFKLSEERVEPYTDYYIWRDPKPINETHTTYPNNWIAFFGNVPAWAWSEKRKQYYYHMFSVDQADLNYRNPRVVQEMTDILRFWLDLGVDGFRVDAILTIYEADHFKDEPAVASYPGNNIWRSLDHIYTTYQPETYELTHQWRLLLDEYKKKDGKTRILCIEDTWDSGAGFVPFMGNETYPNVHTPFYYQFIYNLSYVEDNATTIDQIVHDFIDVLPKDRLPNWLINSHDEPRITTQFGAESIDAFNMISLLLPGSTLVYYGAELGLEDSLVRADQRKDFHHSGGEVPVSRDGCRGPMPWNNKTNAGFTTNAKPWLPLHHSYWRKNVQTELEEPKSHLKIFKRLSDLRKTPTLRYGDLKTFVMSKWTYMFTREYGNQTIAVILNLSSESDLICAQNMYPELPDRMYVHTASLNSGFNTGDQVSVSESHGRTCAELRPKAGVVLSNSAPVKTKLFHKYL